MGNQLRFLVTVVSLMSVMTTVLAASYDPIDYSMDPLQQLYNSRGKSGNQRDQAHITETRVEFEGFKFTCGTCKKAHLSEDQDRKWRKMQKNANTNRKANPKCHACDTKYPGRCKRCSWTSPAYARLLQKVLCQQASRYQ